VACKPGRFVRGRPEQAKGRRWNTLKKVSWCGEGVNGPRGRHSRGPLLFQLAVTQYRLAGGRTAFGKPGKVSILAAPPPDLLEQINFRFGRAPVRAMGQAFATVARGSPPRTRQCRRRFRVTGQRASGDKELTLAFQGRARTAHGSHRSMEAGDDGRQTSTVGRRQQIAVVSRNTRKYKAKGNWEHCSRQHCLPMILSGPNAAAGAENPTK